MELHTQQECLKWGQQKLPNVLKDLEQKEFLHTTIGSIHFYNSFRELLNNICSHWTMLCDPAIPLQFMYPIEMHT